ncbi:hypothetical protein CR513_19867, partial [Mucuna pruriens]
MFLEKFVLASRIATIRKEIYGIRQYSRETLHEYWERCNKLCATCPPHWMSEQLLIQYFYDDRRYRVRPTLYQTRTTVNGGLKCEEGRISKMQSVNAASNYTTATVMITFMFQSNNQVLFGSFVRLTIHISLRYSYDDRQRFVHCHTEELCNRHPISWQGLSSS